MLEKSLLHRVLSRIKSGGISVAYWDGTHETYGVNPPYFGLVIHSPKVIRAMMRSLTLGFGEAYMAGDVDTTGDITQLGRLVDENTKAFQSLSRIKLPLRRATNRRSKQRRQIAHHYDLGNEFYSLWLDSSMTYSCAYFKTAGDELELAQDQKIDHVLRKLRLEPGQTLLDIGCGWGKLLITAAQKYGVTGHGITLSEEQFKLATSRVAEAGLSDKIKIELINYQDLAERDISFDRIVSVGMYEHVGRSNHATYFKTVSKLLRLDGISLLHTITNRHEQPNDAWIDRYIFPGGFLPSVAHTTSLMETHGFELQDYENLRFHYALTVEEWLRRFDAHRPEVTKLYDERFYRMWRLYLAGSISGFRYGDLSLSQFVMTKGPGTQQPLTRDYMYSELAG